MSEYRQERQEKELRRSVQNVRLFESERENGETDSDTFSSLPHSMSESLLIFDSTTSSKFEEKDEFDTDSLVTTTTPSSTPPQGATAISGAAAPTSRSGNIPRKHLEHPHLSDFVLYWQSNLIKVILYFTPSNNVSKNSKFLISLHRLVIKSHRPTLNLFLLQPSPNKSICRKPY